MSDNKQKINKIKIATGVLKRLSKEYKSYQTELVQHNAKLATMKQSNADSYDIKNMVIVYYVTIMCVGEHGS